MKTTFKVTELNHEDLVNLLSTATCGCDWMYVTIQSKLGAVVPNEITKIQEDFEKEHGEYCIEDEWADILLFGGKIVCVDYEDDKTYPITLKDIYKGMNKAYKKCKYSLINFINEDEDYFDANNIMQCVIFGEVVYG